MWGDAAGPVVERHGNLVGPPPTRRYGRKLAGQQAEGTVRRHGHDAASPALAHRSDERFERVEARPAGAERRSGEASQRWRGDRAGNEAPTGGGRRRKGRRKTASTPEVAVSLGPH